MSPEKRTREPERIKLLFNTDKEWAQRLPKTMKVVLSLPLRAPPPLTLLLLSKPGISQTLCWQDQWDLGLVLRARPGVATLTEETVPEVLTKEKKGRGTRKGEATSQARV